MGVTRIADPVHGTVELTSPEAAVISTRAFQRLRGVKHLGLAHLAFPGADYSRFSHGIGTLHVTGLILDNLKRVAPESLNEKDIATYRMAALLHDIGHYPFSHTFEHALRNVYARAKIVKRKDTSTPGGASEEAEPGGVLMHERLGGKVISGDGELLAALESAELDGGQVQAIINRDHPPLYANLVSSDLDADRTDYLMRTALHTGLPYGNVDLPYLLSQIRLDNDQRICFHHKGMRAAEHLLLCRYFDYQQVSFHKTVAAMEQVLNDAVGALLESDALDCRPETLEAMIADGRFYGFDDAHVTGLMRAALNRDDTNEAQRLVFASVLERRPPKLVASRELLGSPAEHASTFAWMERVAREKKDEWESEFGLRFYVWKRQTNITKIGSRVETSALTRDDPNEDETYDKIKQAVRILLPDGDSKIIQEYKSSLIHILADHALFAFRVYALIPPGQESVRERVSALVDGDLGPYCATRSTGKNLATSHGPRGMSRDTPTVRVDNVVSAVRPRLSSSGACHVPVDDEAPRLETEG